MIHLRKLLPKDADFMLEWMNYDENKTIFQKDFSKMTKEGVLAFIDNSFTESDHHFAIVDDDDEYLGTISLKNIDMLNKNAEYAISSRKKARGTGSNALATKQIVEYAFKELKLKKVYLNVLSTNVRAKKMYIKSGFVYEGTFKNHLFINNKFEDLEWYSIVNEEIN